MIFVAGTLLLAYIGSRFITIKPVDWLISRSHLI
jgi:hypothetical protein